MNKKNKISIVVMIMGIISVFYGIMRKENFIIFIKATRICLECIGIG